MKKFKILLLATFLCSLNSIAQEDDETVNLNEINNKKHEIRIDALEGLLLPSLDVSYEYVISKYSGVGASAAYIFDGENTSDFPQKFSFSPYFRQYFFNKKDYGARGFYAEGLLQFATGEGALFEFDEDGDVESDEDWTEFGVGATLGWKFVSTNGFVVDIHGGGGRYFLNSDFAPGGFVRIGVNVGYRF